MPNGKAKGREWTKTDGRWKTASLGRGTDRRSEKQKIGRPPVKSSFGGLPMAAVNGASEDRKTQDRVKNKFDIKIRSTHHLIDLIKQGKLPDKIMLNVHPQRWNNAFVPWFIELVSQNLKNVVKRWMNSRAEAQREWMKG